MEARQFWSIFTILFLSLSTLVSGQDTVLCKVPGTGEDGVEGQAKDPLTGKPLCLPIDRQPALYTGDFGDCLGNSQLEISRFSAAYYKDNLTLSFELEGQTNLTGGAVVMYLSVFAFGQNRFQHLWDPCGSASQNICPLNASQPVYSTIVLPLGPIDVAGIPDIALAIPDFEGQAIMRIFSNQTQDEIACYSASIGNGNSFSQPASVGTIVGLFVIVAIAASFVTAIYGTDVQEMRLHYAHSMSVWVVFAVLQHIFFTGAFSVNWPAVLPAFWSNFAWAAGMIHSPSMQESLSHFAGNDYGNTTFVGAAETGSSSDNTGGGFGKGQVYTRSLGPLMTRMPAKLNDVILAMRDGNGPSDHVLARRDASSDETFSWFGKPVTPGLPLPGNYSGFAGTLSLENIAASNAFMTGFLWLIIVLVILTGTIVAFKFLLEGLSRQKWIKQDRLGIFRSNYLRYTVQVALRTLFIAFFMIIFLALFQFSYRGAAGPIAIASIMFIVFFVGAIFLGFLVFRERTRYGHFIRSSDRLHLEVVKSFPPFRFSLDSKRDKSAKSLFSIPWISIVFESDDPQRQDVHHDEAYIKKFGWLTARFRADKWWFFAFWMACDFFRACFLGGAAGHPQTQVFALLVVEFLLFFAMIKIKPFEGNRLNALMIWLLGLSKIITTALSSAFDPAFNLDRIVTTALGIIIIVIQTLLLLAMLILIILGAISSYMSVMRNREEFRPKRLRASKEKYLRRLRGEPEPAPAPAKAKEEDPLEFFRNRPDGDYKTDFRVDSIRRVPKFGENDDSEAQNLDPYGSRISLHDHASPISIVPPVAGGHARRSSRAFSTHSGILPFGARASRAASWTSHDAIWSPVESRPTSSHHGGGGEIPSVPRIPEQLRPESVNSDAGGYQITPARGRASTLRSISLPSTSRNSAVEEIQLENLKPKTRDSVGSETTNPVLAAASKTHGPSPLGAVPVTATELNQNMTANDDSADHP